MEAFPTSPLILDLETASAKSDQSPQRIFMLGALSPDTGESLELKITRATPLDAALEQLQDLASGADCLVGHNILAHDLPVLAGYQPDHTLFKLPVIDTLRLSPLSFPQNPYHRLIKDYKLVRDALNSPLADCRATWELFQDQCEAFRRLNETHHQELLCYQALASADNSTATAALIASMTGQSPLSDRELAGQIPALLSERDPSLGYGLKVCRTALDRLLAQELSEPLQRWSLAYALAWLRVSGGNSVLAPWVYHQFPSTGKFIRELRDKPCSAPNCQYCLSVHDPRSELKRYFGFDDFRYEADGGSLQHDTVLAGMRGENVLAILPTGGGKSLCYQLPALNRYYRNGSLTVIISPLQSLK